MKNYNVDCAIIGGGVAGLWTLNALAVAGYSTVLIEKDALGNGQTIHSQGIIHGGVKYAGSNDVRADFIAEVRQMPERWREHLSGKQKPNLSKCKVLTDKQYLWVSGAHGWFSPDISISTHYTAAGETVWNIGGKVAEEGHLMDPYELIEKTRLRLARALPLVSFEHTKWSTFDAQRAEPVGDNGKRLGRASIVVKDSFIAALPTKLACAPILADMIRMEVLKQLSPSYEVLPILTPAENIRIAIPPWNEKDRKWYEHRE